MKKVLLLSGALLCSASAWAFNVHFFANDADAPARSVENASKIIFGNDAFTVVNNAGESVKVENSIFDYFKFDAQASGVAKVKENQIGIVIEGKMLVVSADHAISRINLYAIDGRMMKSAVPASDNATVSLDNLTPGVYVLSVESATGNFSKKLIID